jgi:TorA maturation chaperone TorD
MQQQWLNRAALYELMALAFLGVRQELAEALSSGEYAEALEEIGIANGIDTELLAAAVVDLAPYQRRDAQELFHELRIEYTWLFVGAPKPAVSPYAGVWQAEDQGVQPLLFVNKESMEVERFLRSCGVGQPEDTNEPLDHIASELEFLQYLCLVRADVVELPEDVLIPTDAYEEFYTAHFSPYARKIASAVAQESRIPFYRTAAQMLGALPEEPL